MKQFSKFEIPEELKPDLKKAHRYEWITIGYLLTTSVLVYLSMGSSQAMKTAWFEDMISLTPSIAFLIAAKVSGKPPCEQFPYGYHRIVSIAYLCSAVALLSVGSFLLFDALLSLVKQEHATIGTVVIFGHQVWLGYIMILVMLYSTYPSYYLGKKKLPLAEKLHDQILYTDAKMNKADWMTATGTIVGVVGIGFGLWWADAVAAILISLDILHDGFGHTKQSIFDLMDEKPKTLDLEKDEPLIDVILRHMRAQGFVRDADLRLREEGHVFSGQGFVVMDPGGDPTRKLEELAESVKRIDWRIQDFNVVPVSKLGDEP